MCGPQTVVISHTAQPLQVFLCHSSGDKPLVRDLYKRLRAEGIMPWFDEEDLLPGQQWREEIPKAVRAADVVLVCLASSSLDRAGYVQKEIALALDVAEEQPDGNIFVIPVRLEECNIPDRLSTRHWVNLFDDRGYEKLIRALHRQAEHLGRVITPVPSDLQANSSEMTFKSNQKHFAKSRLERWEVVIGLVIGLIGIVSIVGLFATNVLLPSPDVRYVEVGPLRTDKGFSQGILLLNRGREPAKNINVYISYENATIDNSSNAIQYDEDIFFDKPEINRDENGTYVTLRFNRLSGQDEGLIYLNMIGNEEKPVIKVRHDDGSGREGIYERSGLDMLVLYLGFISFCLLIWNFLRLKKYERVVLSTLSDQDPVSTGEVDIHQKDNRSKSNRGQNIN